MSGEKTSHQPRKTALSVAAADGQTDVVHFLLEQKADPNCLENNDGGNDGNGYGGGAGVGGVGFDGSSRLTYSRSSSPLYHAASRGHEDVVVALCNAGDNPNVQNKSGGNPLVAAMQGTWQGALYQRAAVCAVPRASYVRNGHVYSL